MDRETMREYLKCCEKNYDDKEKMIMQTTKNEYNPAHSKYKSSVAHTVHNTLRYASALLDYKGKYSRKVDEILKKIISLQEGRPSKKYYGLWSIFLEEPIEDMISPDQNFAVFNLIELLEIYNKHKDIIPSDTLNLIKSSCFAATIFIVNRNTTLRYSHIVCEECYACVFCGEIFSRLEFVNYGMQKLENFLNYTLFNGDFYEFNSPVYSLIMAKYFKKILENVKNTRVLDAAQKLNKILWKSLAGHYHFQTGLLAGPFSRLHNDFTTGMEKIILGGNDKKIYNISPFRKSEYITTDDINCPPQFYPFFTGEKHIEYSQRLIFQGNTYPNFAYSYTSTTYQQPKYTIGSFNKSEFWSERRPLIGYFGTKESPYCAKLTCLIDGTDFTSSFIFCTQVKNSLIGSVVFSVNHGITHMNDGKMPNKKISTRDLRIRFTVIGNIDKLNSRHTSKKLSVAFEDLIIRFKYNFYKFDIFSPYIEFKEYEDRICYDLVLYSGKKKTFDLGSSECSVCQFSLLFSDDDTKIPTVSNKLSNGLLLSSQKYGDFEMKLKTVVKPQDWVYQILNSTQEINGTEIETYARDTEESSLQYEFIVNSSSEIPISTPGESNSPTETILTKIENILSLDFENIHQECVEILDIIRKSEIATDIAKRFAIRIITNIFEVAKSYSIIFENIIKYEYSNIYINLSQDNSIDAIEKTIISILDKIKLDYRLYSENKKRKDFIDSVTAIINSDFGNPSLSLTYLAEKIGMDEAHISKTFHKRTGMTYLQYLTRVRMEHAKKLISGGESDSERIARECGYENVSSFLRAFKKHTGNTLGTFKKQNQ